MKLELHKKWKLLKPDVSTLSKEQQHESLKQWMNSYMNDIIDAYKKEKRRPI